MLVYLGTWMVHLFQQGVCQEGWLLLQEFFEPHFLTCLSTDIQSVRYNIPVEGTWLPAPYSRWNNGWHRMVIWKKDFNRFCIFLSFFLLIHKSFKNGHHFLMCVSFMKEQGFSKFTCKRHLTDRRIYATILVKFTTCFSNTSIWTSGGEKFLLKSRPHSPIATHSVHLRNKIFCTPEYLINHVLPGSFLQFIVCFFIPRLCIVWVDS